MEPPAANVLAQNPRHPDENILTGDFMRRLIMQGSLLAVVTIIGYHTGLTASADMACTMAFSILCLARLFHGYNCRGDASLLHLPMNLYSIGAFALGALLLLGILLIPQMHSIFDIAGKMTSVNIGLIIGLAAVPTIAIQLYRITKNSGTYK